MRALTMLLLLVSGVAAQDELGAALSKLRAAGPGERETVVKELLASKPAPEDVLARLGKPVPVPLLEPGWHLREVVGFHLERAAAELDVEGSARFHRNGSLEILGPGGTCREGGEKGGGAEEAPDLVCDVAEAEHSVTPAGHPRHRAGQPAAAGKMDLMGITGWFCFHVIIADA